jgi:hypothetical protein
MWGKWVGGGVKTATPRTRLLQAQSIVNLLFKRVKHFYMYAIDPRLYFFAGLPKRGET